MAVEPRRIRPKPAQSARKPKAPRPPGRLPLFAQMPPAVFPVVLGLLGLSLALKRASIVAQVPEALADLVMGLVAGLWLFCALGYAIKLIRRPSVVQEDMATLPGRAGLAAASVGSLAFAAVLATFDPLAGKIALGIGFALQTAVAVLLGLRLIRGPAEGRAVSPVWHLAFVGSIVGALAAVPLGLTDLAQAILWGTLGIAAAIWAASLWQILRRLPPAPLRPLLAIHLAPASLFASVAGLLGQTGLALAMVALAAALALVLIVSARWLTEAGFSPLWGAFTFPTAAFASALMINGWVMGGVLVTVLALGAIPAVAWRVLRMWATGALAAKTNAAIA